MTKEGILNILKQLEDSLSKLKAIKNNYTSKQFSENQEIQDIAKWNFYILTQACLDIGNHIVAVQNLGTPDTYEDILEILKNKNKISQDTASKLQGLAGFRNRLAHGYFKLDPSVLYSYMDNLSDIETYLDETKNSLKL